MRLIIIFFSLGVISLISCQKDYIPDGVTIDSLPPASGNDSTYLSRFHLVDTDPTYYDSFSTILDYDANKRVTNYVDSQYSGTQSSNAMLTNIDKSTFTYSGNATQPSQMVNIYADVPQTGLDTTTTYYYYNSAGDKVKDSTIEVQHSSGSYTLIRVVNTYTRSGTKIYGLQNSTESDGISITNSSIEKDTATLDANGNVLSNRKLVTSTIGNYTINSTLTYDNKINPFARLGINKIFPVFPNGGTDATSIMAKNNLLTTNEFVTYPGGNYTGTLDYTGKYTYRSDNYPLLINEVDATAGSRYTIKYIYRKL